MPLPGNLRHWCMSNGHGPNICDRDAIVSCACGEKTYIRITASEDHAAAFADEIARQLKEQEAMGDETID